MALGLVAGAGEIGRRANLSLRSLSLSGYGGLAIA